MPSAAVLEVSENLRSKIYSIFCKLGKTPNKLSFIHSYNSRSQNNFSLRLSGASWIINTRLHDPEYRQEISGLQGKMKKTAGWERLCDMCDTCHTEASVLQVGEVWDEIRTELILDGVRPISPDQEALSAMGKIWEDTAKKILEEQNSILEQKQQEDKSEEELMYAEVISRSFFTQFVLIT